MTVGPLTDDPIGAELAARGTVALLETRGRLTGRPLTVAVGFVAEPDHSMLVAAGATDADWALNLEADPRCVVSIGGLARSAVAEPLAGAARNRAIRELILRYGTPAERLGAGPAFRLRPDPAPDTAQ